MLHLRALGGVSFCGLVALVGFIFEAGADTIAEVTNIARPQGLIEKLWTPSELAGKSSDRLVKKLGKPDLRPPARETPYHQLPSLAPNEIQSIRRVRVASNRKIIALTFDLCERASEVTGYDAAIVNFLREKAIAATFFASGKWMRSHPEQTLQLMADPLFEIGNHGWTHGNLAVLDTISAEQQIRWTQAQYELLWETLRAKAESAHLAPAELERVPVLPRLFRPPYGRCSLLALQLLARLGLRTVQWSVVSGDPTRGQSPATLAQHVLSKIRPGDIVIFHANGRGYATAQALALIVKELQTQGYSFLTVSKLLTAGDIVGSVDCYEIRPGDNAWYDRKFGRGTGE